MSLFRKTDDELVEHIRRQQRWQRPTAIALMVLGSAAAIIAMCFVYSLQQKWFTTIETSRATSQPTTQQVDAIFDEFQFTAAFGMGFSVGVGLGWAILMTSTGAGMLWIQRRRDRLLLQAWDALRSRGDGPS